MRRALGWATPILSLVGLLAVWEWAVGARILRESFFPPPSGIWQQATMLYASGGLAGHVAATVARLVAAFLLAALPGVAVGLLTGLSATAREAFDPFVAFIYPIPSLLYLPLAALVLGPGELPAALVCAVTPFFVIALNTALGVRSIDRPTVEAAVHYGATGRRLFQKVLLPGALPYVLVGFRVGLGLTLIVLIAVEMVSAKQGLGALLWQSWEILRVRNMYVGLALIATLGVLVTSGFDAIARRLVPWHQGPARSTRRP